MLCAVVRGLVKSVLGSSMVKRAEHQVNKITSDVLFPLSNTSPIRGDKQYSDMHHHEWYGELAQANQQIEELIKKKQSDEDPLRATGEIAIRMDNETNFRILSCVDEKEGGTWMGLNVDTKNMVVLTNVFGPTSDTDHLISRGAIVNGILKFPKKLKSKIEIDELRKVLNQYFGDGKHMRGFNIIMGNLEGVNPMFYMTNRDDQANDLLEYYKIEELNNDIHIVSNSYLDDSSNEIYKKYKLDLLKFLLEKTIKDNIQISNAEVMKQKLEKCITTRFREHFVEEENILNHLANIEQLNYTQDPTLLNLIPEHFMKDGDGPIHFRSRLDSHYNIYVNKSYFKTRSQTIILLDNEGTIHYYYRDTDPLFLPENDTEINKSNSIPWTYFTI